MLDLLHVVFRLVFFLSLLPCLDQLLEEFLLDLLHVVLDFMLFLSLFSCFQQFVEHLVQK